MIFVKLRVLDLTAAGALLGIGLFFLYRAAEDPSADQPLEMIAGSLFLSLDALLLGFLSIWFIKWMQIKKFR